MLRNVQDFFCMNPSAAADEGQLRGHTPRLRNRKAQLIHKSTWRHPHAEREAQRLEGVIVVKLKQWICRTLAWSVGTLAIIGGVAVGGTTTYVYDDLGRVTSATSSNGSSVTYQYDAAGNRTRRAGGGGGLNVTWNPFDKSPSIDLSNGDLTLTSSETAGAGVRATQSRATGKYYFEFGPTSVPTSTNSTSVGINTAGTSLLGYQYVGRAATSYGYRSNGAVFNAAAALATGLGNYTAGSVVSVAVDLTTGKIWFAKNGLWLSGSNPATGVGGYAINPATYFPAVTTSTTGSGTVNFGGSAFAYTIPSGFLPWNAP